MAIGPVYTPIEHRYKGYATAVVAELSQSILNSERLFCTLFTDMGKQPWHNGRSPGNGSIQQLRCLIAWYDAHRSKGDGLSNYYQYTEKF